MYQDILEFTTFSFRIQKSPCPNVIGFFVGLLFSTLETELKNIQICRIHVDMKEKELYGFKNIWIHVDRPDSVNTLIMLASH